jgi:hypothetical protein
MALFTLSVIVAGPVALAANSTSSAVLRVNDPTLSDADRNLARQQGLSRPTARHGVGAHRRSSARRGGRRDGPS